MASARSRAAVSASTGRPAASTHRPSTRVSPGRRGSLSTRDLAIALVLLHMRFQGARYALAWRASHPEG
jgi:hypothetical protein